MGRLWQMILFFGYVTLASAVGVLAQTLIPGVDFVSSILMGGIVFLSCALLHETLVRRSEDVKELRRLLLLKRAFDRNREELEIARDEIRRLFEIAERGQNSSLNQALAEAAQHQPPPQQRHTNEPHASSAQDEADARALFERWDLGDAPPPPGYAQSGPTSTTPVPKPSMPYGSENTSAPRPSANQSFADEDEGKETRFPFGFFDRPSKRKVQPTEMPDRSARADRSLKEANAEVRVLHSLVEQLYAGREKPPMSLSEESVALNGTEARRDVMRSEPSFGRVADVGGRPARGGLRVVDGARSDEPPILADLRDALREDRIDLYLQPIVSLPQRKRRFYECFSRVRTADGAVLGPDDYIDLAREAGLLTAIDNMLLFRCVQLLRKLRRKDFAAAFFCNTAPHSLGDREFFRDFIEYMESHAEIAPNLVLEFSQQDAGTDFSGLGADLDRLAALGYRFSLDGVRDINLDFDELARRGFGYVKVDSRIILRGIEKGGKDEAAIRTLKRELDSRGIDLIIDRIETEGVLVELLDFSIDYGQGYLFGEPRLSKDPGGA